VDTGVPGGYYKDQMYLKGATEFLRRRKELNIHKLYAGKLAFEDYDRPEIFEAIRTEGLKFPLFFADYAKYEAALDRIAETNNL
jgi:hypothetical protein